ncbi:unnamed protein product [Rotaria sp. Silwood1]|nr:unnamed protein product [Rotaria sp. Silwood1]CAF0748016.1 unnamed protein product [Rotaria sp. Silwood1]CAF3356405.1 unnamed protein product [Rotaria sp. Silwood1]CAF3357070.1 unnamed protein product [Rotaria sp. Silwood1]CAF3361405.1 unnamed protein product [Rotaria sp. Silwood1]
MASSSPSSSTTVKRKMQSENLNENQPKRNHWAAGLSTALDDESVRIYKDDLCTVIKDKYPKARIHLLVMPNEHIANLKSINDTHLPLLKHMLKVGKEVAEKTVAKANARGSFTDFRYGYHAIPSMALLHMHVISQDFISDSLKTKKHWNSFTSGYFLDASQVIDDLQANGSVRIDTTRMGKLLDNELKCHRCSNKFTTMPKLKQHLLTHAS